MKKGLKPPVEINDQMQEGMDLENGILKNVARKFNAKITYEGSDDNIMHIIHDKYPFLSVSPDALLEIEGVDFYTEIKRTNHYVTNEILEDVKYQWIVQTNYGCGLAGMKKYIIGYLSYPAGRIQEFDGDFDQELFDLCIEAGVTFKQMLEANEPPEPRDASDIENYFRSNGSNVTASTEIEGDVYNAIKYSKIEKDAKEKKEYFTDKIKVFMKESEILMINNVKACSYKSTTQERVDSKKLQSEYPEIYSKCTKVIPVRSLRFTIENK